MCNYLNIIDQQITKLELLQTSFDYLKITLASPARIQSWAERVFPGGIRVGKIQNIDTVDGDEFIPVEDGLFCEKIFGPLNSWRCQCQKYYGFLINKICDICKVELTDSRVRKYRMGYIELNCPVIHHWYLHSTPSYLSLLLRLVNKKMSPKNIDELLYFNDGLEIPDFKSFLSVDKNKALQEFDNPLADFYIQENKLLNNGDINCNIYGAELIKCFLDSLNLETELIHLREIIDNTSLVKKETYQQLRIIESFIANNISPSWIILTRLPVIPPGLRPLMILDSGKIALSDLNELYRLILVRNEKIGALATTKLTQDLTIYYSKKSLQESVDSLLDNAKLPLERQALINNKPLKSLSELLEGKLGRFRQNLLGKRVDYSARSVIIVNPNLRINSCSLPFDIVLKLFEPFLLRFLFKKLNKKRTATLRLATLILNQRKSFLFTRINLILQNIAILLNRAPTLHRLGVQAFIPKLSMDKAIHLHPLVCTGFNADFDGDQMAVYLPLLETSQLEVKSLMYSSQNILSSSNGEVNLKPAQDIIIGCYYLTFLVKRYYKAESYLFASVTEAFAAYTKKRISLQTPLLVRYPISIHNLKYSVTNLFYTTNLISQDKHIITIDKIFRINTSFPTKYYLLTNIGIFIITENYFKQLDLLSFFKETTIGRLIFDLNLTNSLT